MIFNIALIFLIGLALSSIFQKLKLPSFLGMLLTGVVLGPYVLNLISPTILNLSADLRKIALIIILIRAGLSLDIKDLKKVGRPALLMCFVPATFEIVAITLLAPLLFSVSYLEAAIMGTVLAAVSPAVIVPRMLYLMEHNYGTKKSIPQIIMAGASVDDVYVIVLFAAFLGMYQGSSFDVVSLITIPISIILGLLLGLIVGYILNIYFKKRHVRDTTKVIILLSIAFLFVTLEEVLKPYIAISGLLGIMSLGATILTNNEVLAVRLSKKFSKLWVGAEIILFVLVGAAVNINYLFSAGLFALLLIVFALIFRIIGVFISLMKTNINSKERLFISISYLPKATVQAALGTVPLSAGVEHGELILTMAILAIIITAPIGALGIDLLHKRLLTKDQ